MAHTSRRVVETSDFPGFMHRLLCAWSRRVGAGDTYDLSELYAFRFEVDAAIAAAVAAGRARRGRGLAFGGMHPKDAVDWTWSAIGDACNMSKQAAAQRWTQNVDLRH